MISHSQLELWGLDKLRKVDKIKETISSYEDFFYWNSKLAEIYPFCILNFALIYKK